MPWPLGAFAVVTAAAVVTAIFVAVVVVIAAFAVHLCIGFRL